jgi:hypothetical protein
MINPQKSFKAVLILVQLFLTCFVTEIAVLVYIFIKSKI